MTLRQVNKDQRVRVSCTVNGVKRLGYAEPRTLLSDFLRHELGLYGKHLDFKNVDFGPLTIIMNEFIHRFIDSLVLPLNS